MWTLVRTLLTAELSHLWRRMRRQPEPPGRYADFRTHRDGESQPITSNPPDPTDQGV